MVTPTAEGGLGMTAQWDDDVHHALHVALTGERQGYYADFAGAPRPCPTAARSGARQDPHRGRSCTTARVSTFRGREWGAPVDRSAVDGHRFLAYLQTHDQVGNRAVGDRISASVSPGQQAIGAALYLTRPFTPMVFMGEEWAASTPFQFFTDFSDEALARGGARWASRASSPPTAGRATTCPDPQDEATYRRSQLDWAEAHEGEHARMLAWYRDLIALRRSEAELGDGRLDRVQVAFDDDDRWLVMSRGDLRTVVNLSETAQTVPLAQPAAEVLLAWDPAATAASDQGLRLPGHGCAVVRVR